MDIFRFRIHGSFPDQNEGTRSIGFGPQSSPMANVFEWNISEERRGTLQFAQISVSQGPRISQGQTYLSEEKELLACHQKKTESDGLKGGERERESGSRD